MSNNSGRRGMSPFLAFFLGFLFGIIVLIGAVAGAVYFALNYKLDKISANKDGDGNYIYINADPENGGVENALDLVKKLTEISKSPSSLTLGQVEDLLPVASKLTDSVQGMLGKYIQLDMDELKQVAFSALGEYFQDVVMDIQPASLLENFTSGGIADNFIIKTILYDEEGVPVTLRAFAEGDALNALYEKQLLEFVTTDDKIAEKLLGEVTIGDLVNGNVDFNGILNGISVPDFVDIDPTNKLLVYFGYGISGIKEHNGVYTGKYTLSDGAAVNCFLDTEPVSGGKLKVSEAYYIDGEGNRVTIAGTTVTDINSRVENIMDELTLPDIIAVNSPSENDKNTIMLFLAYSVSDIQAEAGEGYSYTGTYHLRDGGEEKCYIFSDGKEVADVRIYVNGELVSVESTTISQVASQINRLADTLKIKDIINISPDDKLMSKLGEYRINDVGNAANDLALDDFISVSLSGNGDTSEVVLAYVVYGLTGIESNPGVAAGESYAYTGKYNPVNGEAENCYIVCTDGKITRVFLDRGDGTEDVSGTKINVVTDRVSGLTKDLTIGELMKVDESNMIMKAISGSTIESLPYDIENLAVNELYADSIYRSNTDAVNEEVLLYRAVNSGELAAVSHYTENLIYYTYSDGEYSLASTTGKLTQESFNSLVSDGKVLYTAGEGKILFNAAYLYYYYNAENGKYTMPGAGSPSAGKLTHISDGSEYYTYGAANAMWKILMYSDGSETAFSVNKLTDMITNVSQNIQNSTMRELDEAGIVEMGANLDKRLNWTADGQAHSELIGDMTLRELLDAIIAISDMLQNFPSNPSIPSIPSIP